MEKIKVMINGLPGNVSLIIAKHISKDERFSLLPYSLTGPDIIETAAKVNNLSVKLITPEKREIEIKNIIDKVGTFITVDYTHPTAVNDNAEFYCKMNLPFVMGTTGGDRDRLEKTVLSSGISAVIAPNMSKQIVGFQAMMAFAAENFPGLFDGFDLNIAESHQKGKADTSGTAKAMVTYFNKMGIPFKEEEILKERNPLIQKKNWGIPEKYLDGHAWHTYTLTSKDNTAKFEFKHNINGRDIYSAGTMDGILYLNKKLSEGATGEIYSMIDVLKG